MFSLHGPLTLHAGALIAAPVGVAPRRLLQAHDAVDDIVKETRGEIDLGRV